MSDAIKTLNDNFQALSQRDSGGQMFEHSRCASACGTYNPKVVPIVCRVQRPHPLLFPRGQRRHRRPPYSLDAPIGLKRNAALRLRRSCA